MKEAQSQTQMGGRCSPQPPQPRVGAGAVGRASLAPLPLAAAGLSEQPGAAEPPGTSCPPWRNCPSLGLPQRGPRDPEAWSLQEDSASTLDQTGLQKDDCAQGGRRPPAG